jgi:hypothetical protein
VVLVLEGRVELAVILVGVVGVDADFVGVRLVAIVVRLESSNCRMRRESGVIVGIIEGSPVAVVVRRGVQVALLECIMELVIVAVVVDANFVGVGLVVIVVVRLEMSKHGKMQ